MTEDKILKSIIKKCQEACCLGRSRTCYFYVNLNPKIAMQYFIEYNHNHDRFTRVMNVAVNEYKKYYGTK